MTPPPSPRGGDGSCVRAGSDTGHGGRGMYERGHVMARGAVAGTTPVGADWK